MARHARVMGLLLVLLGLIAWPTVAGASSFTFEGTSDAKGVHMHSQGRINFQWVPVTESSSPGDPVENLYWGANDLNVFAAIGQNYVEVRDYLNLNYELPFMWLDSTKLPNINSQDYYLTGKKPYTDWDFSGTMVITSIRFTSAYDIVIGGHLIEAVNRLGASKVLEELAEAPSIDFTINISDTWRTEMSFITALNSKYSSSWGNISGSFTGGGGGTVPEPGTLGLLASALGMGGLFMRRRAGWRDLVGLRS